MRKMEKTNPKGQCEDLILPTTNLGFPGGSAGKESACNAGDLGLIPGLGRSPGEGKGSPFQYSMDCIVHGGHKESNTTEQLSLHSQPQTQTYRTPVEKTFMINL